MNIEDLTIGQAKQLVALFGGGSPGAVKTHPFVGRYCVARCFAAGVHAGTVVSVEGQNVILKDSRRLWSWKASDGIALSGVAQHGITSGKLDVVNPEIYLSDVCELIPASPKAEESIHDFKK